MAEEFVNRLNKIDKNIEYLGETLKRMITILATVTEVKSDVRQAKEEILEALKDLPSSIPKPEAALAEPTISVEDISAIIKAEMTSFMEFVDESIESMKSELDEAISKIPASIPTAVSAAAPVSGAAETPVPVMASSLSPDRAMKVADHLEAILASLKMGCVAGDVIDTMTEAKSEIMKLVPSDQIMVKIDKWAGVVNTYNLRHELQARDILKLKKEIKAEIPSYRPA